MIEVVNLSVDEHNRIDLFVRYDGRQYRLARMKEVGRVWVVSYTGEGHSSVWV